MQLLFNMFSTFMSLEVKLKVKTENILTYGYNAGPLMAIPIITSKLKILQIIMWTIGMAQKAKETRSGCLVHIVQ